jgi:hypothetical protein
VNGQSLRIISGGQTGVDRAALDVAIALGLEYSGWCPQGGWAEDLPDPPGLLARYPRLRDTPDRDPYQRTEWNVRDSDATLVLTRSNAHSAGTAFARRVAENNGKPHLTVDVDDPKAADIIRAWLREHPSIRLLGIGGPRESECPGIYDAARRLLHAVLTSAG